MKNRLDDELARAARGEEGGARGDDPAAAPGVAVTVPRQASGGRKPRSLGLLVTLLALAGGLVALFLVGFKEAAIYAIPVTELASGGGKYVGRRVRVEGELVPGTLTKRDQPCEYRFTVQSPDKASRLDVRYPQCVVPDTFRDMPGGGVQVTVEGKLAGEGHFEAALVMAKCTSKYDPTTHEMKRDGKTPPAPADEMIR